MNQPATVKSIMTKEVITLDRYATFSHLRQLIKENNIHHFPIVEDKRLIGILSATDVLKHSFGSYQVGQNEALDEVLDRNLSLNSMMIRQVMTISPEAPIKDAARFLLDSDFNSLPVVNDDGVLVGILTSKDLIRYLQSIT